MMDIQKEREEFEKLPEIAKRLNVATYSEDLGFYHAAALNSGHTVAYVQGAWMAWQAKSQAVPEGFVLVKMDDLELLRDSALTIKYASLNNDSDRIFSDIEDIQLSIERLIEAQEQSHE